MKEKFFKEILSPRIIKLSLSTNPIYMNKSYGSKCKMTAGVKTPNALGTREKCKVKIKSRGDQVATLQAYFKMLLNYFGNKKGDANLDEIEAKLWELEDFSITYNVASSELVSKRLLVVHDTF